MKLVKTGKDPQTGRVSYISDTTFKILLVGSQGVGKTSLIASMKHQIDHFGLSGFFYLLPMVSESKALGNFEELRKTIRKTLRYCLYMGAFFLGFFLLTGNLLGNIVFQNSLAGYFITTLSFICPFMYLDTTLSSILQGLDMTTGLFLINVSALGLRLLFLFLFVPQVGITGYLWGLLAGQIWTCGLYLLCLKRRLKRLGA